MSNDSIPPDREPLGDLPPLPPPSRLAILKSLGVLSLAVVSAACVGGAIGLGIHWANQSNEATETYTSAPLPQPSLPSPEKKAGDGRNDDPTSDASNSATPQSTETTSPPWLIPSPNLSDVSPGGETAYLYQISDTEIQTTLAMLRGSFSVEDSLADDGAGGFIAQGAGGWLVLSSAGAAHWSYFSAASRNPSCSQQGGHFPSDVTDASLPPVINLPQPEAAASDSCRKNNTNESDLSPEQAQLTATEIVESLSNPIEGFWSFSATAAGHRSASLNETISGKRTGLTWNFMFDAEGNIVEASGHLARPVPLSASSALSPREAVERANSQPWSSLVEALAVPAEEAVGITDCEAPCSGPSKSPESPAPTMSSPSIGGGTQDRIPLPRSPVEVSSAEIGLMQYRVNDSLFLIPAWIVSGNDRTDRWMIPALADIAYRIP